MSTEIDQDSRQKGFEQRDVSVRAIVYTGIGLLIGLVVCIGAIKLALFAYQTPDHPPTLTTLEKEHIQVPAPRLESDPSRDGERIIQQARDRLNSYGWIDKPHGLAHMPIDQAKAELARTGWTTRAQWRPDEPRHPLLHQDPQRMNR